MIEEGVHIFHEEEAFKEENPRPGICVLLLQAGVASVSPSVNPYSML